MTDLAPIADILADARVFTDGDWVESKDQDPGGDVRLTQLADVGDGKWINKSARFLTSGKAEQLRCTYLEAGDLLVARMPDPLGRCCIFPGDPMPCVTVVDVCVIRPNPQKVDNRYLMHAVNSPGGRRGISRHVTGTTRQRISRRNLGRVEIPLPPLAEQKRIAGILDAADALRAKRREALAQLDTLLQSVFLDMFGDPVTNPMGWETVAGEGVAERLTVGIVVRPASYYQDEGVPALRSLNVRANGIVTDSLVYVSPEDNETKLKKTRVWQDDLVLVRSGQPGTAAVVPPSLNGVNAVDILILTPDRSAVDPTYLCSYFNSEGGKRMALGAQRGQIQKHLNVGALRAAPIPLPPLDRQRRFARIVEAAKLQNKYQETHLTELDTLFASLQSRAFRGDL